MVSALVDMVEFDNPVPLRDSDGNHYEPGGATHTNYYFTGVRPVTADVAIRILTAAEAPVSAEPAQPAARAAQSRRPGPAGPRPGDDRRSRTLRSRRGAAPPARRPRH
jgi:hypothetical protein